MNAMLNEDNKEFNYSYHNLNNECSVLKKQGNFKLMNSIQRVNLIKTK